MSDFSSLVAIGGDPNLSRTSACGGAVLWLELLRRSGAFRTLPVQVAGAQGWRDGQMMLTVLLLNVIGHERVSDVDALEADRSLCRLVRDYEPELLGVAPASWWEPVRASEPELECADLDYVSPWGARQSRGQLLHHVGTRRVLPGVLGVNPDETPARSGRPAYRYRVYLTNLPYPGRSGEGAGLGMTASEVVRFAHERCGHGEEVHAVLKQDLAGGMMPSGKFGANAAWWQLAVLSANVNALLRHAAFGRDWLWTRMKQVRLCWVHLVAKVVRHARNRRLVFQTAHVQRVRQALDRMAGFLAYDTS